MREFRHLPWGNKKKGGQGLAGWLAGQARDTSNVMAAGGKRHRVCVDGRIPPGMLVKLISFEAQTGARSKRFKAR